MFAWIRNLVASQAAPLVSGGAPAARPRDLRGRLTVPLETLVMPSIAVEMERLGRSPAKPEFTVARPASAMAWPAATIERAACAPDVQVQEISREEFDRHLAIFTARVPG